MPLLRKPPASAVHEFLARQSDLPFTYPAVGATAHAPPPGYVVDRTRSKLGGGEGVFRAARSAPHECRDGPARKHGWHSGWVAETVEKLLAEW